MKIKEKFYQFDLLINKQTKRANKRTKKKKTFQLDELSQTHCLAQIEPPPFENIEELT